MLAPCLALADDVVRVALWHAGLGREGPGLLLHDIRRRTPDVVAAQQMLARLSPDVLLLLDFDHDRDGLAARAFAALLAEAGLDLPHLVSPPPNSGMATDLDLDGDGRFGTADDAQGWGRFAGSGALLLMSRLPPVPGSLTDHSSRLWRDMPQSRLPVVEGLPAPEAVAAQRLSSVGHWEITVETPAGPLVLMAWHAGPPVFGGPNGRNRARNADETAFWIHRLEGHFGPPPRDFVLLGGANLDPQRGDGQSEVMRTLLNHPALQDLQPRAPAPSGGLEETATAYWPDGPGALRVDYLLPAATVAVSQHGMFWPEGARHAVIWADVAVNRGSTDGGPGP